MIVKNEIKNLGTLLSQVLPIIEEVIVVDTGSTDGTLELLQELVVKHSNLKLHHFDWIDDFSAARNYSFSLATKEWLYWVDGDDQIIPDELKQFKENNLVREDVDCWLLNYVYSSTPDGAPQLTLARERFIRRSRNPMWTGAIHESIPIYHMKHEFSAAMTIYHQRDKCGKTFDYNRNKRILGKEYEKNPNDARTAFYYGKELFDAVDPAGILVLEHYLTLPYKYICDHVGALFRLAKHYLVQKNHRKALDYAYEIYNLEHDRQRAEVYWIFGSVEQDLGNYQVAIDWYKRCLTCKPNALRVIPEEYYTWHPCKRISECYKLLNDFQNSLVWANKYLAYLPSDRTALSYCQNILIKLPPANPEIADKIIVEYHHLDQIRPDSHKLDTLIHLASEGVDGLIIGPNQIQDSDVVRVLKPGGWVWSLDSNYHHKDLQFLITTNLSCCNFVSKFVKIDNNLPALAFQTSPSLEFGPYRIRIHNLKLSAINKGHKITHREEANFLICFASPALRTNSDQKVIMDICEKLPSYAINFDEVDMISVCSPLLKEHLKTITNKPVFVVHDHYEYTDEEWL